MIDLPFFTIGVLFFCIMFLGIVFSVYVAERLIRQPRELFPDELRKYNLSGQTTSFFSKDGVRLTGMFFPGTNGATIILLHGFSRSKEQLLPQAAFLHAAGFTILLFDFRGSGESEGGYSTFGQKEQYDLEGAVRYLKTRPDIDERKIGIFGFSMGGAVALLKSGDLPEIRAVVVDSTFARMSEVIKKNFRQYLPWVPFFPLGYMALLYIKVRTGVYFPHIRPAQYIGRLDSRPVLIIHGVHDEKIPYQQAHELLRSSHGNTQLWSIPEAGHHGTYASTGKEYEERVTEFFRRYLLF